MTMNSSWKTMDRRWKFVMFAPLALVGMALFAYLGGKVVEWLWNWLMPALFSLHTVTFWQALGLLALCRILFGGHGFMRSGGGGPKAGGQFRKHMFDRISDRIVERWDQMTPEERERLWQRLQERRGATGN
jgi:hypothetical protein